jgi:hypothetical protein
LTVSELATNKPNMKWPWYDSSKAECDDVVDANSCILVCSVAMLHVFGQPACFHHAMHVHTSTYACLFIVALYCAEIQKRVMAMAGSNTHTENPDQ